MAKHDQDANPADRRRFNRVPTALRGKVFPGGIDCTVADLSERGACVTFEGSPPEADRMILVMWSTGLAFDGEVRWRNGPKVGLYFHVKCDFRAPTPAAFHEIRAIWRKSRPKPRKPYRARRPVMLGAPSAPPGP